MQKTLVGQNGESRHSEKPFRKPQKELHFRRILLEIFSSGTAGALLIQESTRPAVGQAGAVAPWPLNVPPNKAQRRRNLDIGVGTPGSLVIDEKTSREP